MAELIREALERGAVDLCGGRCDGQAQHCALGVVALGRAGRGDEARQDGDAAGARAGLGGVGRELDIGRFAHAEVVIEVVADPFEDARAHHQKLRVEDARDGVALDEHPILEARARGLELALAEHEDLPGARRENGLTGLRAGADGGELRVMASGDDGDARGQAGGHRGRGRQAADDVAGQHPRGEEGRVEAGELEQVGRPVALRHVHRHHRAGGGALDRALAAQQEGQQARHHQPLRVVERLWLVFAQPDELQDRVERDDLIAGEFVEVPRRQVVVQAGDDLLGAVVLPADGRVGEGAVGPHRRAVGAPGGQVDRADVVGLGRDLAADLADLLPELVEVPDDVALRLARLGDGVVRPAGAGDDLAALVHRDGAEVGRTTINDDDLGHANHLMSEGSVSAAAPSA